MRIRNILLYLAAAYCALSCVKQLEEAEPTKVQDGTKATFTFTPTLADGELSIASDTKSFSAQPQIHNIWVAVFDNAGYKLSEYAEAVPNTLADQNWDPENPGENVYKYSVTLTVTDKPRILHIIANAPEHLSYGSESEVIGSLNTRFNATGNEGDWSDAYWTRIVLDNGVWAKPDESTRDTDADYQTKYNNWYKVVQTLNKAKLVRNFARITLEETANNFELTRYWITNIPDIGSFAPYNRNTGTFQSDYGSYSTVEDMTSSEEGKGNYHGFSPASAALIKIGDNLNDSEMMNLLESNSSKEWTIFCFEREVPKADPVYLIVAGKYNGGEETFYKIDLRDHDNAYFPILRNFNYKVRISNVSTAGASSLEKALSTAPSGAVDSSLEMQDLTNISNGTAQLFVSQTSEIIVGEAHDISLRYKFIPSLSTDANGDGYADAVNTVLTAGSAEEATAITNHESYVTISSKSGSTGDVFSSITAQTGHDSDNYSNIILTSNNASEVICTETVTITGHYYNSTKYETISRTTNFKLRETLSMGVEFSPAKIPSGSNEPVNLIISLEEGLPSSMFSLDFDIEMLGLTLAPNNDPMPITTGSSQISGNNKPAYHFKKTITWSDYSSARVVNGYKQFTCHFKTNTSTLPTLSTMQTIYTSAGGEGTLPAIGGDVVNVKNKYFHDKTTYYSTYSPMTFSNVTVTGADEVGKEGTLSFTLNSPFPNGATSTVVTVGLNGFEPADLSSYPLVGTKDGYELYEVTVINTPAGNNAAYQGQLTIIPYDSGNLSIRVSADEYTPVTKEVTVKESISIYVNSDGSGLGDRMVQATGYNVVPAGSVVAGQKATITAYIAGIESTSSVKFGSATATRSSSGHLTIGEKTYYKYTASYTSSTTGTNDSNNDYGAKTESVKITVDNVNAKSIKIPVYGIKLGDANTSTTHNDYNSGWYVFRNANYTAYHLINNGTNISGSNSAIDYYSLIGFTSSSNSSKIVVTTDRGLMYAKGTANRASIALDTNADSGIQYTVSGPLYLAYGNNFWRQNSETGSVLLRNNTNSAKFSMYKVTFIEPASN